MIHSDYSTWDASDLLEALELSGERPDPELISACLNRRDEVTPGLLDMLARGTQLHWEPEDPRWYRDVHAGLLLIELREAEALPLFEAILRDPGREELVREWFEMWLPEYGPELLPVLSRAARDEDVYLGGRTTAIRLLGVLGERYPETRDGVLSALRGLLPPAVRAGAAPDGLDDPSEEQVAVWTWTVASLAEVGDRESRDAVHALHAAGVLEEDIAGSAEDYDEVVGAERAPALAQSMGVLEFYRNLAEWNDMSDEEVAGALHEALLEAGLDAEAAQQMKADMLALFEQELDDEEDVAAAALGKLTVRLREAGVPESELRDRMEQTVARMYGDAPEETGTADPTEEDGAVERDTDA